MPTQIQIEDKIMKESIGRILREHRKRFNIPVLTMAKGLRMSKRSYENAEKGNINGRNLLKIVVHFPLDPRPFIDEK